MKRTLFFAIVIVFWVLTIVSGWAVFLQVQVRNTKIPAWQFGEEFLARKKLFYPDLAESELKVFLDETRNRPLLLDGDTVIREQPHRGTYVNISENGYRLIKNQAPWPPPSDAVTVFVFGGSTTFGYVVQDSDTIPSYLQEELTRKYPKRKINVYNFGRGSYDSALELLLWEKLLREGHVPDIAIFIDGTNESYNGNDLPIYVKWLAGVNTNQLRVPWIKITNRDRVMANIALLLDRLKIPLPDNPGDSSIRSDEIPSTEEISSVNPEKVIEKWLEHKRIIEESTSKTKFLWVWQPSQVYKYGEQYTVRGAATAENWGRTVRAAKVYPAMEEKAKTIPNLLWLGSMQENIKSPLYMDLAHYSPRMNKMVAQRIADYLLKDQKLFTEFLTSSGDS